MIKGLRVEALEARLALSNFFVAPTGSDSAAGTAGAPWRTLQHAADTVEAGDVVGVRPGVYTGFIVGWGAPKSGTADAPIIFQAQPGAVINARNKKTSDAIRLEGSSYITIAGFTIAPGVGQSNWSAGIRGTGGGTGLVFSDNNIRLRSTDQCGIMTSFTTDLLVQGNTVSGGWDAGIYVANSAVRPVVRGNTISGNLGNGILLNGDVSQGGTGVIPGAVVEKNIIHDVGMGGRQAKLGPGSAINLFGLQKSVINNNLIYNVHAKGLTLAKVDAAQSSTDNLVANNTVIVASDGQAALRLADSSSGNTIVNNVLYSAGSAGTLSSSADSLVGLVMDHNAVAARFSADDGDSTLSFAAWQSQYKLDTHSVLVDLNRSFVNPKLNDYHLRADSPLIGLGTRRAPASDLGGRERAIGDAVDADSPLIGLGTRRAPASDLGGRERAIGDAVDIGVYEHQSGADKTPPTISSTSLAANATGVATSSSMTATFSEAVQWWTIRFVLKDAASNIVPTMLSYDSFSHKATLRPSAPLATSTTYTVTISGVKDAAGNAMTGSSSWSFTTAAPPQPPGTTSGILWDPSTQPGVSSDPDANAIEVGVKFTSDVAGSITGVRFYKGAGNTGTHVGHLWSSTGQLLATAVFTGETASGWQQVNFSTPVAIEANTTYVVSYLAPVGRYAADAKYFASGYASGPIHVAASGGVYKYGAEGGFPTQTWNATNYWVTPVLAADATAKTTASSPPAVATGPIAPSTASVPPTTATSSPTTPTNKTYPTAAGVDQVFADDGGLDFPILSGSRPKDRLA